MRTILITGADGQLGTTLQHVLKSDENRIIALNKQQCNISDEKSIKKAFKEYEPHWLINTAAYNAVDLAQTQQQQCFDLNVDAVRYLAQECERSKTKLMHFSTDYVFSGEQVQPYTEMDACEPLSIYGKTKWLGEQAVQNTFDNFLIFRVSWLFSLYGSNFLKTIMNLLKEKEFLRIVDDQTGCPTSTPHIAELINTIITQHANLTGLYHYSDNPITTKHGFGCYIHDYLVEKCHFIKKDILPIASHEYPTAAARPTYSVLDCNKLINACGFSQQNWQTSANQILSKLTL